MAQTVSDGTVKWSLEQIANLSDFDTLNNSSQKITVTGSTQSSLSPSVGVSGSGSVVVTVTTYSLNQSTGVTAGTYTLKNLLQQLVNRSHTHSRVSSSASKNCNCDCGD